MSRAAPPSFRITTLALLASVLLFAASTAQAIYVDLSGIGAGRNDLTIDGYALTVSSKNFDVMMGTPLSINHLSITFNDGPVALESVDVHFARAHSFILADVMGSLSVISSASAGLMTVDLGGLEGTKTTFTSFGSDPNVIGIEFDISSARGVGSFSAAVPEPQAAFLFAAGLGVVTALRRNR